MRVPYFDLTTQYAALRDEILGAFDRVCRQATFVLGEEVVRFDERGIGAAVHYPTPVHRQRAYAGLDLASGSLPHTGRACARVLSLPPAVRIFVHREPTDLRRSFDSLAFSDSLPPAGSIRTPPIQIRS